MIDSSYVIVIVFYKDILYLNKKHRNRHIKEKKRICIAELLVLCLKEMNNGGGWSSSKRYQNRSFHSKV